MTTQREGDGEHDAYASPPRFGTLIGAAWRDFTALWSAIVGLFALAATAVMVTKVAAILGSAAAGRPLVLVIVVESILPLFVYGIAFAFAMAASAVIIAAHHDGRDVGIRDGLRTVRASAKELITAGIVAGMVAVAFLTLIPPAVLFFPLFLGPPVIVHLIALEQMSFSPAATKARELLTGETLRTVGALMPPAIVAGSLIFFGPYAAAAATNEVGAAVQQVAAISARIALEGVLMGGFAVVAYSVFADLRNRKDPPAHRKPARPERDEQPTQPRTQPSPHRKKKGKR